MTTDEHKKATRHARRYMSTTRRGWESLASISSAFWALWALTGYGLGHRPMIWTGLEPAWNQFFLQAMLAASFLHWVGMAINGRWRWSPWLRFGSFSVIVAEFFLLAALSPYDRFSTATPTYAMLALVFGIVLWTMWIDALDAWKGRGDGTY